MLSTPVPVRPRARSNGHSLQIHDLIWAMRARQDAEQRLTDAVRERHPLGMDAPGSGPSGGVGDYAMGAMALIGLLVSATAVLVAVGAVRDSGVV